MGEKIIFPKLYNQYVDQGMAAFESGQLIQAIESFLLAYEIKQEGAVNLLLATALSQTNQSKHALEIVEDMLDFYLADDSLLAFYIQLLIQNNQYESAADLLQTKIDQFGNDSTDIWQNLQIYLAEEKQEKATFFYQQMNGKETFFLADVQLILATFDQIPNDLLDEVITFILSNPKIPQLSKTELLEKLIDENNENSYPIDWLGERKTIALKGLKKVAETKSYQMFSIKLQQKLANEDPVRYQHILAEGQAHFRLMYPFQDEIIQGNEDLWHDIYLAFLAEDEEAMKRIKKLSKKQFEFYLEKFFLFGERRAHEMGD